MERSSGAGFHSSTSTLVLLPSSGIASSEEVSNSGYSDEDMDDENILKEEHNDSVIPRGYRHLMLPKIEPPILEGDFGESLTLNSPGFSEEVDECLDDGKSAVEEGASLGDVNKGNENAKWRIMPPFPYKKTLSFGKGRRVSFPEDDASLITSYLEPVNPWYYMNNVTNDSIRKAYQSSCDRHNTRALPLVLQQIAALPVDAGSRIERLSLKSVKLDGGQIECLEEIFRRVQFITLDLEECDLDDDTAIPLLDMIEFYDSATHLNISSNTKISSRGWQVCARLLKKTPSLKVLYAQNTNLNEQNMPILCRALKGGTTLQMLHLENCNLTGKPLVNLTGALRLNETISELYIAENHLGANDCIHLGNLVRSNKILRILDLRNNNIQDTGCSHICKDILEQQKFNRKKFEDEKEVMKIGIANLNLWNNHFTINSVPHLSSMLSLNYTLDTLNIGRNCLTSEGVLLLKNSLLSNRCIMRLGMQSTRISNEGAVALAECIADNPVLEKIDLRENCIQVAGLLALCRALQMGSNVNQLDLDNNAGTEPTDELANQHTFLYQEIKGMCSKNLAKMHLKPAANGGNKGEMKLENNKPISCSLEVDQLGTVQVKRYRSPEPSPCPSPLESPSPSPLPSPIKNRFRVFKITESSEDISSSFPSAPISSSLPSLAATFSPAQCSVSRRFTITKVTDVSSLPSSRTMSSPSLNVRADMSEEPTVVISSPSKAIKGFFVDAASEDSVPHDSPEVFDPPSMGERNYAPPLSYSRYNSRKAPLASFEAGSLDSDSEDNALVMRYSDSPLSDEVQFQVQLPKLFGSQ